MYYINTLTSSNHYCWKCSRAGTTLFDTEYTGR